MVKCYRKSVSLSDLWVSSNERLSDFYASSWQRGESPVALLVIRVVLLALSAGILAWSVAVAPSAHWFVYLTNWGLVLITATMLCGTITSIMALCQTPPESEELPWHAALYWFFFNVSASIALMITALYWILLYDPEEPDEETPGPNLFLLDVFTHGVNSCIVMVEVVASRTPVRALHVYQPLGVGLWYAAFSAIYYAAGGTDGNGNPFIYEVLDWRHGARSGVVVAGSAAGLLIIYAALWTVAFGRDKLSSMLLRTISLELALAPPDRHTDNTQLV